MRKKRNGHPQILPIPVSGKMSGKTKGKIINKGGRPTRITKAKISSDVEGTFWPSSKKIVLKSKKTTIKGKAKMGKPPYPQKKK